MKVEDAPITFLIWFELITVEIYLPNNRVGDPRNKMNPLVYCMSDN